MTSKKDQICSELLENQQNDVEKKYTLQEQILSTLKAGLLDFFDVPTLVLSRSGSRV